MTDTSTARHPATAGEPAPTARRARTRQRLLAAALEVFAERGLSAASVEEICEVAGFTRGAFYSNFADKDELVLALLQSGVAAQFVAAEQAAEALREAQRAGRSLEEMVTSAIAVFQASGIASREQTLAGREMLLHVARTPALREPYRAFDTLCREHFDRFVRLSVQGAGLEFTVESADAMALLAAAYAKVTDDALLGESADLGLLRVLLLAITRPAGSTPTGSTPAGTTPTGTTPTGTRPRSTEDRPAEDRPATSD